MSYLLFQLIIRRNQLRKIDTDSGHILPCHIHIHMYTRQVIQYSPPTVKLSVSLAVVLRHITVVSLLMIILDAVTCSVEVKLALVKALPLILILMREALNGLRSTLRGKLLDEMKEVL